MIDIKSFSKTELLMLHKNTDEAVKKAVEEANEEMQCWIEGEEEHAKRVLGDPTIKVVSASTQLVINEYVASYAITMVTEKKLEFKD